MFYKNQAGQQVGATLLDINGDPVTGGGATVSYVGDGGTKNAGTGTLVDRGEGDWIYTPQQAETNFEHVLYTFRHATGNAVPYSVNIYPTESQPQSGDAYARIGANGAGLTDLAPSGTALSNVQWTNARAGYLDNINGHTAQTGDTFGVVNPIVSGGRIAADTTALAGDAGASSSLAAGANQLYPFTVGAGPTATSIPTGITGAPYTNANHFEGAVVIINQERRRVNASAGSPVVLTTEPFNSVPSQNDPGVIA